MGNLQIDKCDKYHSHLLHDAEIQGIISSFAAKAQSVNTASIDALDKCILLQVQGIPEHHGDIVTFFDLGSTISLVSRSYVERNCIHGIPVSFDLVTVGDESNHQTTYLHEIHLKDRHGNDHPMQAFQIEDVCEELREMDVTPVIDMLEGVSVENIRRPSGPI